MFYHCTSINGINHFQIRKICLFPNLENIIIYSIIFLKSSYLKKYTLLNLNLFYRIFGKYKEPRKEITRFAWSKATEKQWIYCTLWFVSHTIAVMRLNVFKKYIHFLNNINIDFSSALIILKNHSNKKISIHIHLVCANVSFL